MKGLRRADAGGSRSGGRYSRVDGEGDAAGDWDETKLDDMSSSDGYKSSPPERFQLDDDDVDEDDERLGVNGRTPYVRQISSAV